MHCHLCRYRVLHKYFQKKPYQRIFLDDNDIKDSRKFVFDEKRSAQTNQSSSDYGNVHFFRNHLILQMIIPAFIKWYIGANHRLCWWRTREFTAC